MNIKDALSSTDYNFLRESEIKKNIILLTFGGSISYGTNLSGSDTDIRGISVNTKDDLLGVKSFGAGNEQLEHKETDTVIYELKKIVKLFLNCNPNTIEMLYTLPEHRIVNDLGQILIDNRDIFLSQIAAHSFNGFAISQLHRLQNALSKEGKMALIDELRYECDRLNDMVNHFNHVYSDFTYGTIRFNFDPNNIDKGITISNDLKDYPVEDLVGIYSEINSVLKSWKKVAKLTEREKDSRKLNKHAMHLIRLYMMGIDILEGRPVSTYRDDAFEHALLMDIRNGRYMNDDGTYDPAFFNLVKSYQRRFEEAKSKSKLPFKVDTEIVNKLLVELQYAGITGDFEELIF